MARKRSGRPSPQTPSPPPEADWGRGATRHVLGALKPSEELFAAARARLGERPEHVLLVDDSPVVVEAARRLGLAAVRFTSTAARRRDLLALL